MKEQNADHNYLSALSSFISLSKISLWLLRQTRGLLLVIGIGIVISLTLVCAVPIYSDLAMTLSLRNDLNAFSTNAEVVMHADATLLPADKIQQIAHLTQNTIQQHINVPTRLSQFQIDTPSFALQNSDNRINLFGFTLDAISSHIHLIQGHIPQNHTDVMEILLPAKAAQALQLHSNDTLTMFVDFTSENQPPISVPIALKVAGIFEPLNPAETYWRGEKFDVTPLSDTLAIYRGIASSTDLLQHISQASSQQDLADRTLYDTSHLTWYYHLNAEKITIFNFNNLLQDISDTQREVGNSLKISHTPFLQNITVDTSITPQFIAKYHNLASVADVPITTMITLVLGLVLFFVNMMVALLIRRVMEAIILLRSRGASSGQIVLAFLLQGLTICIISLIVGTLLSLPVASFLAQLTLAAGSQNVGQLLWEAPVAYVQDMGWLPLLIMISVIIIMTLTLFSVIGMNVLTQRREVARVRKRSLLESFRWDGIAIVVAIVAFGFSSYILSTNVVDERLRLILLLPLTILEVVSISLAVLLLLMRFFSLLLRWLSTLTARGRNATLQLAFSHMARASQEPARQMMLLAISIAFALFALIFLSTQYQRADDVVTYQTGADFAGKIEQPAQNFEPAILESETSKYRHLSGVTAATLGYTVTIPADDTTQNISLDVLAVDAKHFADTARWNGQTSEQSLASLMHKLAEQSRLSGSVIPAIVDNTTWQKFNLSTGKQFSLSVPVHNVLVPLQFVAIEKVTFLPSLGAESTGSLLVDYRSFVQGYSANGTASDVSPDTVWLKATDAASAQKLRTTLTHRPYKLTPLYDYQAMLNTVYRTPAFTGMVGMILLGALVALLLAFIGNFVAAWLRVITRQTNLAVLRALGATNAQIGLVLSWEQAIIALAALLFGGAIGCLLAYWLVPSLVNNSVVIQNSNLAASSQFYVQLSSLPTHIVISPLLLLILLGLIVIGLLSLFMVVRIGTSVSLGQQLRLNED